MLTIKPMTKELKSETLDMIVDFYSGPAVDHQVERKVLEQTFEDAISGKYPLEGYLLYDDEKLAGFAYMSWYYACEVGGLNVMFEELYLSEHTRGKGYGSQFINAMFEKFKGARRFRLEVTKENKDALRLYKRLGFDYIGYDHMIKDI